MQPSKQQNQGNTRTHIQSKTVEAAFDRRSAKLCMVSNVASGSEYTAPKALCQRRSTKAQLATARTLCMKIVQGSEGPYN
eukprot:2346038-Rhodomonas_salina.1